VGVDTVVHFLPAPLHVVGIWTQQVGFHPGERFLIVRFVI
jgi:hypothetical protein